MQQRLHMLIACATQLRRRLTRIAVTSRTPTFCYVHHYYVWHSYFLALAWLTTVVRIHVSCIVASMWLRAHIGCSCRSCSPYHHLWSHDRGCVRVLMGMLGRHVSPSIARSSMFSLVLYIYYILLVTRCRRFIGRMSALYITSSSVVELFRCGVCVFVSSDVALLLLWFCLCPFHASCLPCSLCPLRVVS